MVVKLKFFILISFLVISYRTHAQPKQFTLKGGLNLATISTNDLSTSPKLKVGFHLGVAGTMKLSNAWTFQPELIYSNQGYKSSYDNNKFRVDFHYATMPLLLKYTYKKLFINTGPQFSLLLRAKSVPVKGEGLDVTVRLNMMDVSLNAGLGFMLTNTLGLEGRYVLGVSNLSESRIGSIYNRLIQVSILYTFKQKKS